jgi:hypothetical protein
MPIFRTAYDTLACHGFILDKIRHPLEEAYVRGALPAIGSSGACKLVGNNDKLTDGIPVFDHPFEITDSMATMTGNNIHDPHVFVVGDLRRFGRFDPHQKEFVVKVRNDYGFQLVRTVLNQIWVTDAPSTLGNCSPLPMKFYGIWVADAIARRYYLDPHEKLRLQVLASIFYAGLFYDIHDHWDKNRVAAQVKRAIGVDAKFIFDALEYVKQPINSLIEFVDIVKEAIDTVRLKELNHGILYAALKGTWYGVNNDAVVAVALEHPPTWLAMLYVAINDRSYSKSQIATLIQNWDKRDKGRTLEMALSRLAQSGLTPN